MNTMTKRILLVGIVCTCFGLATAAQETKTEKQFSPRKFIQIQMVSGNCSVKADKADKISVRVSHTYNEGDYQPVMIEEEGKLILKEEFKRHTSFSGNSHWDVTVPGDIHLTFSSASGDLTVAGIKGTIEVRSASGDIEAEGIAGELSLLTASGNIRLIQSSGNLKIKSASGDIELVKGNGDQIDVATASGDIQINSLQGACKIKSASGEVAVNDVQIKGPSAFKTASGDVQVKLGSPLEFDVTIASASGDAVLNFNGQPLRGEFILTAKKDSGNIKAPFKFDKEEEFEEYDHVYIRKIATRGTSSPRITVKTASGSAVVKEKE